MRPKTGSGAIFLDSAALPAITQPLTVDGTTHPDFSDGFPGVVIDGSGLTGDGLHVTGGTTTIRGVEIDSFAGDGIQVDTAGNNVLKGNSIGAGGTITGAGISIASSTNVVGGTGAGEANAIEAKVWPLVAEGKLKPVIDSTYKLAEAAAAHARIDDPYHIGKIVLVVER